MAVVGLGWMGRQEAELYEGMDGVELVAGVDTDREARAEFADEHGAETYETCARLFDRRSPDAATIATPHLSHYDQVMTAIDADVDVLVEKPMVVEPERAVEIGDAADAAGVEVRVGYHRRFNRAYREIKRLLDAGELGDVTTITCHIGLEWVGINEEQWRMDPSVTDDNGYLYDMGSHLIEALLWTTGAEIRAVSAVGDDSFAVDVNTAVTVELLIDGNLVPTTITLCGESVEFDADESLTIWGKDARLTYRSAATSEEGGDTVHVLRPDETEVQRFEKGTSFEEMTRTKLASFVDVVRGDGGTITDHAFARRLTYVRDAIARAQNTGSSVRVDVPPAGEPSGTRQRREEPPLDSD